MDSITDVFLLRKPPGGIFLTKQNQNVYPALSGTDSAFLHYPIFQLTKKVKKEKLLFIGTTNYSLVHPREVFKEAYLVSASGIICIHNHPSGNTLPSKEDFDITDKLVKIGNIMGIKIIDHVIISKNNYYSFFENNDLC